MFTVVLSSSVLRLEVSLMKRVKGYPTKDHKSHHSSQGLNLYRKHNNSTTVKSLNRIPLHILNMFSNIALCCSDASLKVLAEQKMFKVCEH